MHIANLLDKHFFIQVYRYDLALVTQHIYKPICISSLLNLRIPLAIIDSS